MKVSTQKGGEGRFSFRNQMHYTFGISLRSEFDGCIFCDAVSVTSRILGCGLWIGITNVMEFQCKNLLLTN